MLRIEMYKNRVVVKGNTYYINEKVSDELFELAKNIVDEEIEYQEMNGVEGKDIEEILEDTFETCILEYLEEVA
ncbi:hypothetical protein [Clostridium massiliamazoniense]|uniref:hypothetical protein n=1 Tax=Clostridium massiliamazoniense TaxID=1347366 RepID=UPI0006D811B8|nr:hypothetical protein [Clostridium massiliamazoniense]